MSSDIMYSTKNYRNDWVSQFGLYRYESAATPNRVEYDRRCLFMKITFLLCATLFLALLIFYIAVYMSNYNEVDRMIFLSKLDSEPSETSHMSPLTTVFYPDNQISTYQHALSSTTPMPTNRRSFNETLLTSMFMQDTIKSTPTIETWHPSNHKRQYSNVQRHRGNDFVTNVAIKKSSTPKYTESPPQKRMFFQDDDFDYGDSYRNVNSIQDILNQNSNENENFNDEDFIMPSMPFSRTMKVEGIYRREKKKRDHLATMETIQNGQITYDQNNGHNLKKFDQFLKFKPSSPSDVNLLASNIMKTKQYSHHKPRPVTASNMNKYHEERFGGQDPNIIYHQILSASNKRSVRNGRYEKPPMNNKPFSLMLDVYPMPEEETQSPSSTRITSHNQYRRPIYPINSHAVNHNLQYNKENAFYNHLKFPQLQPYPYNRSPYVLSPNPNDGLLRQYASQRMNTNNYRQGKQTQTFTQDSPHDEAPSQITVHLNLFPNRKKYQTQNVEILNIDATSPNPVQGARNDISIWKRLEQYDNATATKLDLIDIHATQPSKPYIPPFSAIKINTLQHSFDLNDTDLMQQSTDKTIEYNLMQFDSKKLIPTIKLMNLNPNPTANSIISTASPYFADIESTIPTDLTETIAPTSFNQFETTMSSSTFTSPINQWSIVNTNNPFVTTAASEVLNESELDQPTTIHNEIHFPIQ